MPERADDPPNPAETSGSKESGAPPREPDAGGIAKISPMIAQYRDIKAANPGSLLFYRMGDFYELFLEDAEDAAKALGIVLTKRGKHQGDDIPMCGVPVERAQDYLHRLIGLGHRVAVCEQVEDPADARKRGGKSVVRREVTRLVTPGTITEDPLLDPRSRQSAAGARPRGAIRRRLELRPRRARHFDGRVHRPARRPKPRSRRKSRGSIRPKIVVAEALLDAPGSSSAHAPRFKGAR